MWTLVEVICFFPQSVALALALSFVFQAQGVSAEEAVAFRGKESEETREQEETREHLEETGRYKKQTHDPYIGVGFYEVVLNSALAYRVGPSRSFPDRCRNQDKFKG